MHLSKMDSATFMGLPPPMSQVEEERQETAAMVNVTWQAECIQERVNIVQASQGDCQRPIMPRTPPEPPGPDV